MSAYCIRLVYTEGKQLPGTKGVEFLCEEIKEEAGDLPPPKYKVDIDPETAWRKNKVQKGGSFRYACGLPKRDGTPCRGFPKRWAHDKLQARKDGTIFVREWGPCRYHS